MSKQNNTFDIEVELKKATKDVNLYLACYNDIRLAVSMCPQIPQHIIETAAYEKHKITKNFMIEMFNFHQQYLLDSLRL